MGHGRNIVNRPVRLERREQHAGNGVRIDAVITAPDLAIVFDQFDRSSSSVVCQDARKPGA